MNTTQLTQINTGQQASDSRLKELEEENELLFNQLHVVQEELERLASENHEKNGKPTAAQATAWVDDALPEAIAEDMRLQAVLDIRKHVHDAEVRSGLNARLGDILIQGMASPVSLFAVPGKLLRVWRESKQQTPPNALGGKTFDKVIASYHAGGFANVESLLASALVSPSMQANALTALARSLLHGDPAAAAEAAQRAFSIDPRPFRLKWLAFRLHEAGDVNQAEAMLDALPTDMQFSDSEGRQASRIRSEAKQARLREARQKTGYSEGRAEVERQMGKLTQARNEQMKLAEERAREIEALKAAKAQLEQEKSAVAARHEEQMKLAEERAREIEALKAAKAQLEQEKSAVAARHEEQMKLAEERAREIEA
ncbi:hypothetical protein, partial [Laribacter hongkongensis]|uniref:hypothetical protein n=1 Tax=Laribacter hongkongensis TaxID=168471 RepID=UPI001EFE8BC7